MRVIGNTVAIPETFKFRIRFLSVLLLSILLGLGGGILIGRELLHRALVSDATAFFIFRPAGEFFSVYSLINSRSELKRLSGYYSLMEYGHSDDDFLIERYSLERSPAVKRTIVWMLGFSGKSERVAKFLSDAYPGSSGAVRDQILQSLSRVSPLRYRDFVKKNAIKNDLQDR
jgi:hypothetical protein